jgi:sarcosine oxidase subunit beta
VHVCIVGGGIVGLASAHALATRGATVTLLEQGHLGSGATDRAVGGIRAQFSRPENVRLSLASMDIWEAFEDRFGVDVGHRREGYLFLARGEATAADLRESAAMQADLGVPVSVLDPEGAAEHCSELRAERYTLATYSPTDGWADPHLAVQGYASACREAGVDLRTKTAVTDLLTDGERVVGAQTDEGAIRGDYVVNAAGAWAARVAAMADLGVPVSPRRRQVAVVDPETPVPESVPLVVDLDSGSYFRPEREGRALVGGHFAADDDPAAPDRFREKMDTDWAVTAVERADETARYFGPETRIRNGWAGLYAVTPDHSPILEETVPGFVQAVGFSGHGFQHAPATGQVVADLCLDGGTDLVDLGAFRGDRFGDGSRTSESHVA